MNKHIIFTKRVCRQLQNFHIEININNCNLSIRGNTIFYNTQQEFGGQCQTELNNYLKGNPWWDELYKIWNEYHLNDMQPGTPEQMECLKNITQEKRKEAIEHLKLQYKYNKHYTLKPDDRYNQDCLLLRWYGLYEVELPDGTMYKYGYKWLKKELPEEVINFINEIPTTINIE